jgi:hypothetical protein
MASELSRLTSLPKKKDYFLRISTAAFGFYAPGHFDRHHGMDLVRAARARHWLGQIREMESAEPASAGTRSNGSGTSRKNAQPDESGAGNGSAPGIDAAVQHFLSFPANTEHPQDHECDAVATALWAVFGT